MDLRAVDVVILARSDGPLLRRAIAAVLASEDVDPRVFIVDLGGEPSVADIDDERVSVVRVEKSTSHAHARNVGIAQGHSPSVLLLEPEVHLATSSLRLLVEQLDVEVAAAAPVFVGLEPERTAGRAWTLSGAIRRQQIAGVPAPLAAAREQVWNIDYAAGACLLIERAAWESVGGFDETFSRGTDDLDFCLRLRAAKRHLVQVRAASARFVAEPQPQGVIGIGAFGLDGPRQRIDQIRSIRRYRHSVA